MKNKFLLLLLGLLGTTQVHAETTTTNANPRVEFLQLIAQLQSAPTNDVLREKIIVLTRHLHPPPEIPDAATEAEGAAESAFKNAKDISDYGDAAKEYEKALLLAPWVALDYYNCGAAHEKAGENKAAISNFKFYLIAAPNSEDDLAVKKRIGALQYAEEKKSRATPAK